jgi:hypothetical protein
LILRWLFYAAYKEKTNDSSGIVTKMLPHTKVTQTACCGSDLQASGKFEKSHAIWHDQSPLAKAHWGEYNLIIVSD